VVDYLGNVKGEADMDENKIVGPLNTEIMTLREIAQYLKLSEKTVLRMIRAGDLPAAKVASRWRFMRPIIDKWLAPRMKAVSTMDLVGVIRTTEHPIPLSRLITPERIILNLEPGTKESVLSQLVEPLRREGVVSDPDRFLRQLLERESIVPTAIGDGVAVPHVRAPEGSSAREPCIVLGICRTGTDFLALDGLSTHVFGLICTSSDDTHLRLMAKISLLFRKPSAVNALRQAKSKEQVMSLLIATDNEIGLGTPIGATRKQK